MGQESRVHKKDMYRVNQHVDEIKNWTAKEKLSKKIGKTVGVVEGDYESGSWEGSDPLFQMLLRNPI